MLIGSVCPVVAILCAGRGSVTSKGRCADVTDDDDVIYDVTIEVTEVVSFGNEVDYMRIKNSIRSTTSLHTALAFPRVAFMCKNNFRNSSVKPVLNDHLLFVARSHSSGLAFYLVTYYKRGYFRKY